jgi:O-antigen/teichoic acid export membrane protein
VYGAVYALSSIATIVLAPLSTVFFPKQVRLAQADRRVAHAWLQRIILAWCAVVALELAVLLAVGPFLLDLVLADELTGTENVRLLLSLTTVGVGLYGVARLLGHVFLLDKRTGRLAGMWVLASVFSVALNLVAIPWLGLEGAALTTVATYAMVACAQLVIIGRRRAGSGAVSELSPA